MGLQHFKLGEYTSIEAALRDIHRELSRLQPIDSESIKHSISNSGVTSHAFTYPTSVDRYNESSEDSIGYTTQASHQFKVLDTSATTDSVTTFQVSVVNGHSPGNAIAGYVNSVSYPRTDLPLTGGLLKYYIYAIDGELYALGHTFSCDLFPVVLLATVDISTSGGMTIIQESFADNIIVNVAPKTYGATTLTYTITYNDYSLLVTYNVEASAFINSTPLTLASTTIPANATGKLYAYIMKTTVDPDTKPEAGFEFTAPEDAQFTRVVLQYQLGDSEFHINSRTNDLYFFTFTKIFLNASESGE